MRRYGELRTIRYFHFANGRTGDKKLSSSSRGGATERSVVFIIFTPIPLLYGKRDNFFWQKRAASQEWSDDTQDDTDVLTLNISGQRYQTYVDTLGRYPTTLLGSGRSRQGYYISSINEYFFDRHRSSFDSILYFYQSGGTLKRPPSVPLDIFLSELKFFEFPDDIMETFLLSEGYFKPPERKMPKGKFRAAVWDVFEHPDSGKLGRFFGFFSIFVICVSITCFCLETLPQYKHLHEANNSTNSTQSVMQWHNPFYVIEFLCIIWFTVELLVRFATCPSRKEFCLSILNFVDLIAILPFYANLVLQQSSGGMMSLMVLRVLRLFRVFRIFKLSRHSRGLRILGETFKASFSELCLLVFFLVIAVVLFSSMVFFAESLFLNKHDFSSIPQTFWYAVVTMTTVGYGDITPKGPLGRLVGSACAIIGVLVIALPVPVIVENFKHFYRQENRMAIIAEIEELEEQGKYETASSGSNGQ